MLHKLHLSRQNQYEVIVYFNQNDALQCKRSKMVVFQDVPPERGKTFFKNQDLAFFISANPQTEP